jgi:hypothetical protein
MPVPGWQRKQIPFTSLKAYPRLNHAAPQRLGDIRNNFYKLYLFPKNI